jgi:hypothetical protein
MGEIKEANVGFAIGESTAAVAALGVRQLAAALAHRGLPRAPVLIAFRGSKLPRAKGGGKPPHSKDPLPARLG